MPLMDEAAYRLPRTVTPSRYDLTLEPDLGAGTFTGSEDVAVTVHEPVTEVVLNANELRIVGGWIADGDARRVPIARTRVDEATERAHLELQERIDPGAWLLH